MVKKENIKRTGIKILDGSLDPSRKQINLFAVDAYDRDSSS